MARSPGPMLSDGMFSMYSMAMASLRKGKYAGPQWPHLDHGTSSTILSSRAMAIKFNMIGSVSQDPAVLQHVFHQHMMDDAQLVELRFELAKTATCTASHIFASAADAAAVVLKVSGEEPQLICLRSIRGL